ncbi:MAG TPA: ATP-binding protein [Opitutaceae bacterium]|jgi:C4-dicarboxylate-specific signal transduction histidine kinase|nr:ATP-binding protein [Opitutaceae bacterium]
MKIRAPLELRYSPIARYLVGALTAVGAVIVTRALRAINPGVPADLIYCATIFSAWFGGLGPGLLAAAISSAGIALQFIPPPAPGPASASELPRTVVIGLGVFLVSWVSGRQRMAEIQLQRARDNLDQTVKARTAELQRSNEALLAMRSELAHVSRVTMMGELAASIAHEVNQPLGAITNYANACRRLLGAAAGATADVDLALARIVEEARRASDIIAGIRRLSRKIPPERSVAEMRSIVDEVVVIVNSEARARGVRIEVRSVPDLPSLRVDRIQIQQVLLNLIMNGIEAMESLPAADRGIELTIAAGSAGSVGAIVVQVRDHGSGIGPDEVPRLFTAFHSTKPQGLGMGLRISRSIIEAHGGRLSLIPSDGAGATFQIILPVSGGASA